MPKTTLIIFKKYLPALLDVVKEDEVGTSRCKNIKKSENKKIEILAILKSQICVNLD